MIQPFKKRKTRKRLSCWLTAVVACAIVMGVGPGVFLVNRPTMLLGLPLVYVWGIFWYLVICAAAIVAYRWLWCDHDASAASQEEKTT